MHVPLFMYMYMYMYMYMSHCKWTLHKPIRCEILEILKDSQMGVEDLEKIVS